MHSAPIVFLDANIFKFSRTSQRAYVPRSQKVQWGPLELDFTVHDEVEFNPLDQIPNPDLRREADLLPQIAELGLLSRLTFVWSSESWEETYGLPRIGNFFGAKVNSIESPICHSRIMGGFGIDSRKEQYKFLQELDYPRFSELQRATGAYQGEGQPPNRNQLLDAFHLWCAEEAGCKYFLTMDFKLQRMTQGHRFAPKCQVAIPSQLLSQELRT